MPSTPGSTRARHLSGEEVVAESRGQLARIRDLLAALPEEDLFTPGRYPWLGNDSLADVPLGTIGHLSEEHLPAIRAWPAEGE